MAVSSHQATQPRRAVARLLNGCIVCGWLAAGGGVATAAGIQPGLTPIIRSLHPSPGAVLAADSPSAYIAARVMASAPIRRIEVRLDGRPIGAEVLGPDDHRESLFAQPPRWPTGRHHVVVLAWDVRGHSGRRAWTFWIGPGSTPKRQAGHPRWTTPAGVYLHR
jgi:hypothetical protein